MLRSKRTLRDVVGLRQVDKRRRSPAAVAIELGRQGLVFLGEPGEAGETMLDLHHLGGLAGERSVRAP